MVTLQVEIPCPALAGLEQAREPSSYGMSLFYKVCSLIPQQDLSTSSSRLAVGLTLAGSIQQG